LNYYWNTPEDLQACTFWAGPVCYSELRQTTGCKNANVPALSWIYVCSWLGEPVNAWPMAQLQQPTTHENFRDTDAQRTQDLRWGQ